MSVHEILIPKGNGQFRRICIPDARTKRRMREALPGLLADTAALLANEHVQGFMPGRSPVTNALLHVGFEYSLCMDLKDFFDSVTFGHLGHAPALGPYLHNNRAAQGLPTSPLLANYGARGFDKLVLAVVEQRGGVYTRYADDITYSCDSLDAIHAAHATVAEAAAACKFTVNGSKTHIQCATAGRRIITGVAVDRDGIYPTRATLRKLRAARHNGHTAAARGLAEWAALKPPNLVRVVNKLREHNRHYLKVWGGINPTIKAALALLDASDGGPHTTRTV